MTGPVTVDGRVHQNLYLPAGERDVHAVVSLTVSASPGNAPADAAEVVVLDASRSMGRAGRREAAVAAAGAAIGAIRDGVRFAVVAGSHEAWVLWPEVPELRVADDRTRAAAVAALADLPARGGTAIGRWLELCRELLDTRPDDLRHVTLLTDGRDEHETPERLDEIVRSCAGRLRCDCRGVGESFDPAVLCTIAERLDGTMRAVVDTADPAGLVADLTAVMDASMAKQAELELLLWTPAQATVGALRQVTPVIAELEPSGPGPGGTVRYRLGAFGEQTRDYHLWVRIEPPPPGPAAPRSPGGPPVLAERLAARLSVAVRGGGPPEQEYYGIGPDGAVAGTARGQVYALWTHDPVAPLTPDEKVAAARGGLDLARDLRSGIVAWRAGRTGEANAILHDVRERAGRAGDAALAARLDGLRDPTGGGFHLGVRDELELFEESTVTTLLDL